MVKIGVALIVMGLSLGLARGGSLLVPADRSSHGEAFTVTLREVRQEETYTVSAFSFPSPAPSGVAENDVVPGELYQPVVRPETGPVLPAVIVFHILNGNFALEQMLCASLAASGITALYIKLPFYGERAGRRGRKMLTSDPELFFSSLQQGFADGRRAVDLLCALPAVDPDRIGAAGISLGALLAPTFAGREPRVRRIAAILGGGNLRRVIESARETREIRELLQRLPEERQQRVWEAVAMIEPLNQVEVLRPLAASGRLLMICAGADEVIPPACARELAEAVGCRDVRWLEGAGHYTAIRDLPRILQEVSQFFAADLPEGWRQSSGFARKVHLRLLAEALSGLGDLMLGMPAAGQGHQAVIEAVIQGRERRETISLRISRHADGFSLAGQAGPLKKFAVGVAAGVPWMQSPAGKVFQGSLDRQAGQTLTSFVSKPQRAMLYQMAAGMLQGLRGAPEFLATYGDIEVLQDTPGAEVLRFRPKDAKMREVVIEAGFAAQGKPASIRIAARGVTLDLRIAEWALNIPMAPAAPPPEQETQAVRQEDLLRMFAAGYERLLEEMGQ